MRRRRWRKFLVRVAGLGVLLVGGWHLAAWLAPFPDHLLMHAPENLVMTDAAGRPLRRVLSGSGLDAEWVAAAEMGEWSGPAIISVEDQRFARHRGVDVLAILRASGQNLRGGGVVSGASTLSTQVIRMIEPRPRTLRTKVIEAFRATQLEQRYDKAFILTQYLNRMPVGGNRMGVATAARRYYGKEPGQLSAGEAALVAGLPQRPSRFSPDRFPERAEARRETVLRRMRAEGVLDVDPVLSSGPLWVAPPSRAPHFTEWIRLRHQGTTGRLQTTLDPEVQGVLESVAAAARGEDLYRDVDGLGMLVLEARTGAVRGWVGGWDPAHPVHGQVDTVTHRRAPGSTLKPFAYAQAMTRGWLTPETMLADRPQAYRDYRPRNMDRSWDGEVTARDALARSLNLPALEIARRLTLEDLSAHFREVGLSFSFQQEADAGLGMVLGGGMGVSLLELAGAYTAFAGEGMRAMPWGAVGDDGVRARIYAPGVAWWITDMLAGPERNLFLHGHAGETDRPALAFKTGTSHGHRDAWVVGWNADWVIGIWVGRMDNGRVNGLTGGTHAAPLLGDISRALIREERFAVKPKEIIAWREGEILAGITDPDLPAASPEPFRIVYPTPGFSMVTRGAESVRLPLRTSGGLGGRVHWFCGGEWVGAWEANDTPSIKLPLGVHHLRAVSPAGDTAYVQVHIRMD